MSSSPCKKCVKKNEPKEFCYKNCKELDEYRKKYLGPRNIVKDFDETEGFCVSYAPNKIGYVSIDTV